VDQDLFLAMGGMAWAFNIRKKRGPDGREIPVHWNDYTPLLIAKPRQFAFDAIPRDEARMREMERMWHDAKEDGDEFELWTAAGAWAAASSGRDTSEIQGPRNATGWDEKAGNDSDSDHDVLINVPESPVESSGSDDESEQLRKREPATVQMNRVPGSWC